MRLVIVSTALTEERLSKGLCESSDDGENEGCCILRPESVWYQKVYTGRKATGTKSMIKLLLIGINY